MQTKSKSFLFLVHIYLYKIGIGDIESDDAAAEANVQDFSVNYAPATRDNCIDCHRRFDQNELRIMRVVQTVKSDKNKIDGLKSGQANWYHVACFVRQRSDIGWLRSGDSLPGFKRLLAKDKKLIQNQIP